MHSVRGTAANRASRLSKLIACCALAVVAAGATLYAADTIRVVPLVREDVVLISFELENGFTEDVRAAIYSGLRTAVTYTVELRVEVPAWVDRTIATAVVTTSVEYDNLARRHNIFRLLDGRIQETRVTEDESVVREWLTHLDKLPLFRTSQLEPNREYYVRVRAHARPRNGSFWPWAAGPSGQSTFTFIR